MGFWDSRRRKITAAQDFANKEDMKQLHRRIDEMERHITKPQNQSVGGKLIKALSRGFGNIAESLNNPEDNRRMKISQMPVRPPIATTKVHNPIAGKNAGMKRHKIVNLPKSER